MIRTLLLGTVIGAALLGTTAASTAVAHDRKDGMSQHPKSAYYRHRGVKPQVRGYMARRGGYSYSYADSINTYGSSRTLYGGTLFYRDPMLDRQTNSGPFDHGFFFDSAVTPRGGESPYMN
jgi:hypothetical protein